MLTIVDYDKRLDHSPWLELPKDLVRLKSNFGWSIRKVNCYFQRVVGAVSNGRTMRRIASAKDGNGGDRNNQGAEFHTNPSHGHQLPLPIGRTRSSSPVSPCFDVLKSNDILVG